jgi:ATP-dependent protease HslVU (ClpYQ) peptidase subunit
MTTIVAIQGEGFSLVGSDSRICDVDESGYVSMTTTLKGTSAKVAVNGKYLLGAAGDVRAINILHHVFTPPVPPSGCEGQKLDKFFTMKFIPALRGCFEQQGYAMPAKDSSAHVAEQGSTILAVINSTIYVVNGDYSWSNDRSGIYALGSGAQYAVGALHARKPKKDYTMAKARSEALLALQIASRFDPHTGPPFNCVVQN